MSGIDTKKIIASLIALKDNPKAIIAIAIVAIVLDFGLILRWQIVSLGRAFSEGKKLRTDIVSTRDASKMSGTNKARLEELRHQEDNLRKMIVGVQDLPSVLESVSKSAEISGVRILRIQPVGDSKASSEAIPIPGDLKRQRITISARSGFHQLGRFVALLEGASVFMDIKNVEIQGDDQEFNKQVVTIVLEVLMQKA
jgi:Tfp pilus assembly protein PilO